jgi:hypothetical protein
MTQMAEMTWRKPKMYSVSGFQTSALACIAATRGSSSATAWMS